MVVPGHIHFSSFEQMFLSRAAATRLLAACALGGAVGMEREWRHKDSGLRTNMLICMGSALFTLYATGASTLIFAASPLKSSSAFSSSASVFCNSLAATSSPSTSAQVRNVP